MTAYAPHPCPFSADISLGGSSQLQETEEEKAGEQVVSEVRVCDFLAKMEKGRGRA